MKLLVVLMTSMMWLSGALVNDAAAQADKAVRSETFRYVPMKLNYKDTIGSDDIRSMFAFTSTRRYSSDSAFTDTGIMCSSQEPPCSMEFKIVKGSWYVKSGRTWTLFYDARRHALKHVRRVGEGQKSLVPRKTNDNDRLGTMRFELYDGGKRQTEVVIYLFNPALGIFAIENSSFALVRTDVL